MELDPEVARVRQRAEPELMQDLVDDAGLFPPTALSMPAAVARHRVDQSGRSRVLTHRFLCPVSRVAELCAELRAGDRIDLGLIADNGPDGLAQAVAAATADEALRLVSVEFPLARTVESDPPAAVGSALAVIREAKVADTVPVFMEPRALADVESLAPAVAQLQDERPVGLKLRCGGVRAELFPSPEQLAAALIAVTRAGVVVKATAGLHHAVRYTDPSTGFTHHGYLNLLMATAEAVSGRSGLEEVAATLRVTDPATLTAKAAALDPDHVARTRAVLVSYGSCSTSTPLTEARVLGLT
ncbi:hypothetical protein [Phytoactinopolyspora mesophila]|uniref:Aldolase n=1 Tax=Phytoactinopolyspora mesophila TaxID=2650750 RepID=A0A7K3LWS6_9ACTN|nr:hypothetical protein [Phytoactinopolyspora mesophila]NDL55474.1 hypothetical protein [Phytoactinopolyspora mesophila]